MPKHYEAMLAKLPRYEPTAEHKALAEKIEKAMGMPARKVPEAIPREEWPWWAKLIALRRKPGDIGIGDTAERIFGHVGGQQFKRRFKQIFKKDCGCNARKELWNRLYGY